MQGFLAWFGERYEEFCSCIKSEMEVQLAAVKSALHERVKKSLFELYWLLCRFSDYAEAVGAISAIAKEQLVHATEQALTEVWHNIAEELRRIENRPKTIRAAIISGVEQQAFGYFTHKGCICVKLSVLTVATLAAYLHTTRQNICKMLIAGEIRSVKVGRSYRVPKVFLQEFLKGSSQQPA